jgi:hypothetical protein
VSERDSAVRRHDESSPDLVVTYCSGDKDPSPGLIAASDRYLSGRIRSVREAARLVGADFRILSGKFGLITATREIPDYDHVLTAAAVADHAAVVEHQLRAQPTRRVVFVVRAAAVDPGTVPYHQTMQLACDRCGVTFSDLTIGERTPAPGELAAAIITLPS